MHSAAILAGGRATRFAGRDKGALTFDGRTIRDRQIAVLAQVADDVLIVGGIESAARRDAAAVVRAAQPREVDDIIPGCGPLGGLHTALTHARHDRLFVVACDMPHVTPPFVSYLLALASTADAVVPQTAGGYHPLCAVYTRACLEPAARLLAERRLKMTDLLRDVRVCVVTAADMLRFGDADRLLANVNTPSEYVALQGHKH